MRKLSVIFLVLVGFLAFCSLSMATNHTRSNDIWDVKEDDNFKFIVSIDGGGARGIIPAAFLNQLEHELRKDVDNSKFGACCDLLVGTSFGGILSLGLSVTNEEEDHSLRKPRYSAKELLTKFKEHLPKIFLNNKSWWSGRSEIRNLFYSEYDENTLNRFLKENFKGKTLVNGVACPTCVTCWDLSNAESKTYSSFDDKNLSMPEVAYATVASPTKPAKVTDKLSANSIHCIGGIFNPIIEALETASQRFPECKKFLVLSLDTSSIGDESLEIPQGQIGWAKEIDILFKTQKYNRNKILEYIKADFKHRGIECDILSIRPSLHNIKLDDVTSETLQKLENIGKKELTDPIRKKLSKAVTAVYLRNEQERSKQNKLSSPGVGMDNPIKKYCVPLQGPLSVNDFRNEIIAIFNENQSSPSGVEGAIRQILSSKYEKFIKLQDKYCGDADFETILKIKVIKCYLNQWLNLNLPY